MKYSQLVKYSVLAIGIACLTACSHTGRGANGEEGMDNESFSSAEKDAQTHGMRNVKVGSPEFNRLAQSADHNKCVAAALVGGIEQHVYFEYDQSGVDSSEMTAVKAAEQFLLSHPNAKVRVEGHADDRGSREYNVALGMRRANAVISLLKGAGVAGHQISVVSYGAEKPAAFGESEKSYRCNRRVDIVFTKLG